LVDINNHFNKINEEKVWSTHLKSSW